MQALMKYSPAQLFIFNSTICRLIAVAEQGLSEVARGCAHACRLRHIRLGSAAGDWMRGAANEDTVEPYRLRYEPSSSLRSGPISFTAWHR